MSAQLRRRHTAGPWILALTVALAGCAPGGLSEEDELVLMAWLTCTECTDGERAAAAGLGQQAVPLLSEILLEFPDRYLASARQQIGSDWTLLSAPALDSAAYVDYYTESARALAQVRAAAALGDLGAVSVLQAAVGRSGQRPDVADAIQEALVALGALPPPGGPPASVEIQPDAVQLDVGGSDAVGAIVLGTAGSRLMNEPVSWASANDNVAAIASEDVQRARITAGLSPGTTTITATAGSANDQATVTVVAVSPDTLRKTAGESQTIQVGELTPDSLEVEAANFAGPAPRRDVTWQVLLPPDARLEAGGLAGRTLVRPTNASGRSWVYVRAGAAAVDVQIRVSIVGDTETFRINVIN